MPRFIAKVQYPYSTYYEKVIAVDAPTEDEARVRAIQIADSDIPDDAGEGCDWCSVGDGDAGDSEVFAISRADAPAEVPAAPASPAELCERYSARLDELEIAPNGDDFNNLLQILATGVYIEPHVTGR